MAVHVADDGVLEILHVRIDRVGKHLAEDDHFRMFQEQVPFDEGIIEVTHPQVVNPVDFQEVPAQRLEKEAAEEHEARPGVVLVGRDQIGPRRLEPGGHVHLLLVADDVHFQRVVRELALHRLGHLDALAVHLDETVAGHRQSVHGEDHVADLEFAVARPAGHHVADENPVVVILQPERMPLVTVLEVEGGDGHVDVFVVVPIGDVPEEVLQHRGGDHVADVLGDIPAVALESHADDLVVLQHRAAAVAGVDGRVDLTGQVAVHRRVAVGLEVDARHDALRDREPLAANGIAEDRHAGLEPGDAADLQRAQSLVKIGVADFQHGQVAIVRDELDPRRVLLRIVLPLHRDEARVADHVRVGDDARPRDDETCAYPARHVARVPRHLVVGVLRGGGDPHHAAAHVVDLRVERGEGQQEGAGDEGEREEKGSGHRRTRREAERPRGVRNHRGDSRGCKMLCPRVHYGPGRIRRRSGGLKR